MNTQVVTFDKLTSKDPKVKYGYAKELLKTSLDNPGLLYSHYDDFVKLSDSDNNILKWTAIQILGNLSAVDDQNKTESQIERLFTFLQSGHLITCNHAIYSLGEIAKNKPPLKATILDTLLKIPSFNFDTDDCRNIAIGKVLNVLNNFKDDIKNESKFIVFLNMAAQCGRSSTQKKAQNLLSKLKK